ncbi:alpha/beta fold hydrolase [Candidatus Chlorohelix sp.]|uniref:alpha/beta hydrolase n=1 Tax=Candidatus Chlorohelix sp. TaxID=3139201 RepID=UPI00305FEA8E
MLKMRLAAIAATIGVSLSFRQLLHKYAVKRLCYPPRQLDNQTPAILGLEFEEFTFLTRDKLKLQGWFIPAENSKATIIIAHGYAGSKVPDIQHAEWLRQGGYNVFMFDFRGHGRSEGSNGTSMAYIERIDLHAAVDWLLNRGERRIGVIGFSMGAAAAIIAAAENPHIAAVVADSPFSELWRSITTEINRQFKLPESLATFLAKYAYAQMAMHHRFLAKKSHPSSFVRRIAPRPLFLIHGGSDTLTPLENSRILYALAKEPKTLWIDPESGHVEIFGRIPKEYKKRALAFFDAVNWQASLQQAESKRWQPQFAAHPVITIDERLKISPQN